MKLDISQVRICNYEPKYAKGIAELWNNSGEAWNNHVFNYDEEKILNDEANSTSFAVFLALYEEEVIGYVNLKQEAEDIAHVESLAVLPAYHGCKVGKALMQRCVLKTMEMGFPGLSLYTWGGNTKAVPLYKKCGFFWQKMDEPCTFLVNFLPYIMSNELLKPYFEYFDWYQDLVRELKLEPDDEGRDGYIYYTYLWQKADRYLRVVYDKASRSITEIENNDFHVCLQAANPTPIFGSQQKLTTSYKCLNEQYQDIAVNGIAEHNVIIDYAHSSRCTDSLELEATYTTCPSQRKFTSWDARPAVKCKITLGGKSVIMGVSQLACAPVKLGMSVHNPVRTNQIRTLYLDLQSNLDQDAIISLHFPRHAKLNLINPELKINLKAEELKTVEAEFSCEGSCYYHPVVKAEYQVEGAAAQSFELYPELIVTSLTGTDAAKTDSKVMLLAGQHQFFVTLRDQKNWAYFCTPSSDKVIIRPADFGRPFTDEFETEDAYDFRHEASAESASLEVFYQSKKQPGLKYSKSFTLYLSGELRYFVRFQAIPDTCKDLVLRERVGPSNHSFSFVSENGLIRKKADGHNVDFGDISPDKVIEPWMYFSNDNHGIGITWDQTWTFGFDRWWLGFEYCLADLMAMNEPQSPFIYLYPDDKSSSYSFRDFLYGKRIPFQMMHPLMEITANEHNPICGKSCELLMDFHAKVDERLELIIPNYGVCQRVEAGLRVSVAMNDEAIQIFDARLAFPHIDLPAAKVLLRPKGSIRMIEDEQFISVSHSTLSMKARKVSALPTVCSLEVNGMEWLDPIPLGFVPRGYANPYPGGILTLPYQRKVQDNMQDAHKLSTVSMKDQHGNIWEGLAWESEILDFEPLKGVKYRHQYVTMPGIPILMIVIELLEQLCGTKYQTFVVQSCFHPQNVMPGAEYSYQDYHDRWHKTRHSAHWNTIHDFAQISRLKAGNRYMHILSGGYRGITMVQNHETYCCSDYRYSEFPPVLNQAFQPLCMIFGQNELDYGMMGDLLSLRLSRF
ncbi:MAG TPA: GNAT family N-acetyltransferase [Candidatus Cloacimonadota bacterium]|nr:GNAT family N-acetyltransferase [Candidatus Cloacimonadota bacterium]